MFKKNDYKSFSETLLYLLTCNFKNHKDFPLVKEKIHKHQVPNRSDVTIITGVEHLVQPGNMFIFTDTTKTYLKILAITLVVGNLYVSEGLLALIPQEMGIDNIYLNRVCLGLAEVGAYLTLVFVSYKIKRRLLNIMICITVVIISLSVLTIALLDDRDTDCGKLLESGLSILLKIIVCINFVLIFNYATELFDKSL